jgi:hypothetical protein
MLEVFGYFWMVVVYAWIVSFVAVRMYKWQQKRSDEKFLRYLKIRFPDSKDLTFISVSTSDEEALKNIKEQLNDLP